MKPVFEKVIELHKFINNNHQKQISIEEVVLDFIIIEPSSKSNKLPWKGPLLSALIRSNKEELACLLIEAGADLNILDVDFMSSLYFSVNQRNRKIFDLLIKHGAFAETKELSCFTTGADPFLTTNDLQDNNNLAHDAINAIAPGAIIK